jgi:AmmeMemoRadiSam system protein B
MSRLPFLDPDPWCGCIMEVRPAAVAGTFYPSDSDELAGVVSALLAAAPQVAGPCPKVVIVPHAGYVYSGPIAASAFARIVPHAEKITRVVIVGPAHRVAVDGLVWPGASRLATPLGEIAIDLAAIARMPELRASVAAHAREHSLEVELPFLQRVAPHAKLVPLVVGRARPEEVGAVLDGLWGGPETLIVISSDLSHYEPYRVGRDHDRRTAARIVEGDTALIGADACGAAALNGLAWVGRTKRLRVELIDLRSSGDTAGSRDEVVGYGAFVGHEVQA